MTKSQSSSSCVACKKAKKPTDGIFFWILLLLEYYHQYQKITPNSRLGARLGLGLYWPISLFLAVHGLLILKRKGVTPSMLMKYYQASIFPILSYASPAWHSHLSQNSKDKLERHQSLSLKLIHPTMPSYTEWRQVSNIGRINDVLHQQCMKYVLKVANNTTHRLHHLVPLKQSQRGH